LELTTSKVWLRIRDDGTNVSFYMLPGGDYNNPDRVYTVAKSSGYLANYNNIFLGINQTAGKMTAILHSYIQR
jgi:hypothetical protein